MIRTPEREKHSQQLMYSTQMMSQTPIPMSEDIEPEATSPSMTTLASAFLECLQDEERSDAGHEADDNSPASRVRQRYERMFRDRDNAEMLSDDAARAADAAREAANAAARTAFHGSIATVFTKHLRQAPPV